MIEDSYKRIYSILSDVLLVIINILCFYVYVTHTTTYQFNHWQIIVYSLIFANSLCKFTEYFDEDSFWPMKELLNYLLMSLILPCYTAEIWVKNEFHPSALAFLHSGLGLVPTIQYMMTPNRRQDLIDLANFGGLISLLLMGAVTLNIFTVAATLAYFVIYYLYQRSEDQICHCHIDSKDLICAGNQNVLMMAFAILSLLSLDDYILEDLKNM